MTHPGNFYKGKVQTPSDSTLRKGPDAMYPFSPLEFSSDDIKNRYNGIKLPLSIFAPYSHEEEPEQETPGLDRPVTPINDEVTSAPSTFSSLAKYIRRRISAEPDLPHMSEEDQQELAGIIMGELSVVWPHLRTHVDYPFLSQVDNKELQRRITVHIISGCQKLFKEHVEKLNVLNKRGIFSGTANMTRLKAQLALNTSSLLNMSRIRRQVLDQMKTEKRIEDVLHKHKEGDQKTSFKLLAETSKIARQLRLLNPQVTAEQEIQQLMSRMPNLDTSQLLNIVANLPEHFPDHQSHADTESSIQNNEDVQPAATQDEDRVTIKLARAKSMPGLGREEKLLGEMGYDVADEAPHSVCDDKVTFSQLQERAGKTEERLSGAADLARLMQRGDAPLLQDLADDDSDLPPLIQALPRNAKHDQKKALIMKQLRELEEREKARIAAETIAVHEPKYPQPSTVTTTVPNKMTVKASDMRVSERVCLSSLTLQKYETIYNDLTDQISAEDVKKLDSNLFLGDEIREVYSQIMDTVPMDHLLLEQDGLIEPAADSTYLTTSLSSSTLRRKKTDRVINPKLHHAVEPPWGDHSVTSWANMPKNFAETLHAASADIVESRHQVAEQQHVLEEVPSHMQDFMARSYASWLMWWKNTINSDDYMKYLSTQETDYLGVVFHFYNSDGEDDEEDDASRAKQASKQLLQQQKETKLSELRGQKETYEAGFWNANSVMLGGLGKDPSIPDEHHDDDLSLNGSDKNSPLKTSRKGTSVVHRTRLMPPHLENQPSPRHTYMETPGTLPSASSQRKSGIPKELTKSAAGPTAQERLERVWSDLMMPDNLRLDMAIKYSSDAFFNQINQAIEAWEDVTEVILKREAVLGQLETFERLASDPNRFFEKGARGSSVARLDEAKTRSVLYRKIEQLDAKLTHMLKVLKDEFKDVITFQGRPYQDKMKWDRVEMLYWLQEERKQQVLSMHSPRSQMPSLPSVPAVRSSSLPLHPIKSASTTHSVESV